MDAALLTLGPDNPAEVGDAFTARVRQVPGFVTAHWIRLGDNSGTSMLIFESEEAAQAGAEQLRANPPPSSAVTIDSVEMGDVVEQA